MINPIITDQEIQDLERYYQTDFFNCSEGDLKKSLDKMKLEDRIGALVVASLLVVVSPIVLGIDRCLPYGDSKEDAEVAKANMKCFIAGMMKIVFYDSKCKEKVD
jgi:hypothetical protein